MESVIDLSSDCNLISGMHLGSHENTNFADMMNLLMILHLLIIKICKGILAKLDAQAKT